MDPGDGMIRCRYCPSPATPKRRDCLACRGARHAAQKAKRDARRCSECGVPSAKTTCGKVCQGKRAYRQRCQREEAKVALEGTARRDAESRRIEAALALLDKRRKGQRWAA